MIDYYGESIDKKKKCLNNAQMSWTYTHYLLKNFKKTNELGEKIRVNGSSYESYDKITFPSYLLIFAIAKLSEFIDNTLSDLEVLNKH